jgi:aminopeptidase N
MNIKTRIVFFLMVCSAVMCRAQYTRDDTLRGSITPERGWWDLTYYDLDVEVDIENQLFSGSNKIHYTVLEEGKIMQIDLQPPMQITGVSQNQEALSFEKIGTNAWWIYLKKTEKKGDRNSLTVTWSGKPKTALKAPWDGGIVWSFDADGKPFIASANQGIGASIWWPCKDHPADEPDSLQIRVTAPDGLWNISNGKLRESRVDNLGRRSTTWFVKNPINNYGVNINIGNYVSWTDTYRGEKGDLNLSFYVLPEDLTRAKKQFQDVYRMLEAFEYWFGPYPFYEDGYKLIQVPYLGMEHQSSITYGNGFGNGYLGTDLSGTGWGLKWDFIIVHESGHEWFANNITYRDEADMWVHESFTNYSETLFTEYFYGKSAASEYVQGLRSNIQNDKTIIADYGVNAKGSGDMYYKGGNMLHTIRQVIADDELWRSILRGINRDFYHQTVTSAQIENYISEKSGINFSKVFDQYLRTVQIPELEIIQSKRSAKIRWKNVVHNFNMPIDVATSKEEKVRIYPNANRWKKVKSSFVTPDKDYYITVRRTERY